MKKAKVAISIAAAALLLLGAGLLYMNANSLSISRGRFLIAENGSHMMILDDRSPIVLSNVKDNSGLFEGLTTGDEILVLHDGIQESYPGRTGAYAIWKLNDGDIGNIPEVVLEELGELGWYPALMP